MNTSKIGVGEVMKLIGANDVVELHPHGKGGGQFDGGVIVDVAIGDGRSVSVIVKADMPTARGKLIPVQIDAAMVAARSWCRTFYDLGDGHLECTAAQPIRRNP